MKNSSSSPLVWYGLWLYIRSDLLLLVSCSTRQRRSWLINSVTSTPLTRTNDLSAKSLPAKPKTLLLVQMEKKKTAVLKSKGVCWLCMFYWCVSSWTGVSWGRLCFANEFFTSWVNKQHHTAGRPGFDWKCSTFWLDRWSTEVDMSFLGVDSEKHFEYFFYPGVFLGLISEKE